MFKEQPVPNLWQTLKPENMVPVQPVLELQRLQALPA